MADLIFKTYTPKPEKNKRPKPKKDNTRKPNSKSITEQLSLPDKSLQINSYDVPFEVSPASVEAAGINHRCQTVVGDNETRVQDIQVLGSDLPRTRAASKAEKGGSNDDTDNKLPSTTRLLSAECKHAPIEESPSMTSVVKKGSDQVLEGSLICSRDSIELRSDYTAFNTEYVRHIVNDSQSNSDAFTIEHSHTLFNPTVSKHDDSNNSIDNTKAPQTSELQRPSSPCSSIRHYNRTPLLPPLDDRKRQKENTDHSDPDDSGDEYRWSKRQKTSTLLSDGTKFSSERSKRSFSLMPEDEEDGTLGSFVDGKHAGTARTTAASESASTERELCPQVIDPDEDWEVREIIGKEYIGGVLHYMVDWYPTLLPEQSLEDSKDLIHKFEARLRAQRGVKQGRGGTILKLGGVPIAKVDALGLPEPKKPRGRPQKRL